MAASNKNRPCVNTKNGKVSHFFLFADSTTPFTETTEVKPNTVQDMKKGYKWDGKVVGRSGGILIALRLKCTQGNSAVAAKGAKATLMTGLDTGKIDITLTDTDTGVDGPTVTPVPVDYLVDDET